MKLHLIHLTALLLVSLDALHAEAAFAVTDRTVIFKHTSTDPQDAVNTAGFNHGPSMMLLPDGRVMAAWFSLFRSARMKSHPVTQNSVRMRIAKTARLEMPPAI